MDSNQRNQNSNLEAEAKLLSLKHEMESFIYTVSHDLRSPLVSLQGFIDLLVEENSVHFSEDSKHYVDRINFNLVYMNKLLQDMLELSRISSTAKQKEQVVLADLFAKIVNAEEGTLKEKKIGLIVKVEKGLSVFVYEKQLETMLQKLLDNAIKFMGDGPKREILLRARLGKENKVIIEVKDTGIGIEAKYHELIFDIFERLDTSRSKLEGTGVGLFMVKKIVEDNAWSIWVESKLGEGSLFVVELT